jgi:protein SCO1/2
MTPSGQSATPSRGPVRIVAMIVRLTALARTAALVTVALLVTSACVGGPARRARTPLPSSPTTAAPATVSPTATLPPTPAPVPSPGRPSTPPALVEGQPAPDLADLVRTDGGPFRIADEAGHPTVLFFGYTHCPDVCPETIATLLEVARERPDVRIVFVTVDPERDTQEFLTEWVEYLPDSVVGLTGTPDAIRRAADRYAVQYARVDTGSAGGYAMAHTAFQYLIGADGVLERIYPFATPAATIISDLDALQ